MVRAEGQRSIENIGEMQQSTGYNEEQALARAEQVVKHVGRKSSAKAREEAAASRTKKQKKRGRINGSEHPTSVGNQSGPAGMSAQ